jgi:hypothetical protein
MTILFVSVLEGAFQFYFFPTVCNLLTAAVVDREVGTIIRSMGCCPTEAELNDMLAEVSNW